MPAAGGRTALRRFTRLEAEGVWRPSASRRLRDVIVSLGEASLTIHDLQMRPLAHWSLASVRRIDPGGLPAVYVPDGAATETLEIRDTDMIEALDRIRRAVTRQRARPGRLRRLLTGALLVLLLAALLFALPEGLRRYARAVLPPSARAEIGEALLQRLRPLAGAPCRTPLGARALERLAALLRPEDPPRILVLREGLQHPVMLPGGTILLPRRLVETLESPEALAGFILAVRVEAERQPPLERVLAHAGILELMRLLLAGRVPEGAAAEAAAALAASPLAPPDPALQEDLIAAFAAAGLSTRPYAYALDVTGESTLALIEADPHPKNPTLPIRDGEWVALQAICENGG